jgi:hypothetical protein
MRSTAALTAFLLGLAACAGSEIRGSPRPDLQLARSQLAAAAASGPIPLAVLGDPAPLTTSQVAELAATGISGLRPTFVPASSPPASSHLVLAFDATVAPDAACAADRADASGAPSSGGLLAIWCEGRQPVAYLADRARGEEGQARSRGVWQLTRRLFPDDYPERYGFNLFGWRVRLGGSVGL